MSETSKTSKDLRIRNVSLHKRGHTQHGSLYLTRHHLIFSYVPDKRSAEGRTSNVGSGTTYGGQTTENERSGGSLDGASSNGPSDSTVGPPAPRARSKEVWVPYPIINQCMLRPSHSQGFRTYDHDTPVEGGDVGLEDTAFPPTYGTSSYDRPSTDSARRVPYASPKRSVSPGPGNAAGHTSEAGRVPALRLHCRDFQMMAFHFHQSSSGKSPDDAAREVFYCLRSRCCIDSVQNMHAFHFHPPQEELAAGGAHYEARREFSRMGIGGKAAEGPGSAWRLSDINCDYAYSPTYPSVICVPRSVSDNMLKYGGVFRSKARIPALTYLHSNGGSITRSSQPLVGIQSKRNPQDERLVSAIFSSHTPIQQSPVDVPTTQLTTNELSVTESSSIPNTKAPNLRNTESDPTLDEKYAEHESVPRKRIYGSTRRNMIIDARPKVNALANRATGGGIEDVTNYTGASGTTVERIFLNIANIHAMRKSLDKVMESFANSDYLEMKPNQELLRNSGWLAHISNMLDGSEMVARVVGLGGGHILLHCSDGWDRTSQVAALAEIMLDPFYRSLRGFITLIQKDFLSFGHKFNHRHGIQGSEKWFEIENERVPPSRTTETATADTGLNKALSGAKNWFDKNRNTLFRQQNDSKASLDGSGSRPPSPPPNPILHSTPTTITKEDREHKTNTKEISPIFHQFLDAVFQLQHQFPTAFEFNERFLRRLFYHAHSGSYGEFLFNNEKDRIEHTRRFPSVWSHFLSRQQEFVNPDYVAKIDDPLLFPRRHLPNKDVEVRWWSALFQRKDEEMNTARALAPPDGETSREIPRLSTEPSTVSQDSGGSATPEKAEVDVANYTSIKETKSTPSFGALKNDLTSAFTSLEVTSAEELRPTVRTKESPVATRSDLQNQEDADNFVPRTSANSSSVDNGDPLGVSGGSTISEASSTRLDFAAFARQSAYSER